MISSKSLKYTVRILLGTLIGVYLGIIVLLNIPYVQGKLSVFVTKELKNILNTEVSIGRIDMGLLNRIIVEDVLLHDRKNQEMLKVARLSAKFDLLPLLNGKVTISSVQLFGFTVNLNRETPESAPNFLFVLDAFASKDTVKTKSNLDLRINSVLIRRQSDIRYIIGTGNSRKVQCPSSIGKKSRCDAFTESIAQRLVECCHPAGQL